ncbi:UNVERIFIED_CONTAM: hypothetical protein HDU68_002061 [Siphonaria sp. JEL0065]|nr:hypothetical protein HDU68_002061 [Siphonaria sp. JEL0065]
MADWDLHSLNKYYVPQIVGPMDPKTPPSNDFVSSDSPAKTPRKLPPLTTSPVKTGFEIFEVSPQFPPPPSPPAPLPSVPQNNILRYHGTYEAGNDIDITSRMPPPINTAAPKRVLISRAVTPSTPNIFSSLLSPMRAPKVPMTTPATEYPEIENVQTEPPPITTKLERFLAWFNEKILVVHQGVDYTAPPSILATSGSDTSKSNDSLNWIKGPGKTASVTSKGVESTNSLLMDATLNLAEEYMTPTLTFKLPALEDECTIFCYQPKLFTFAWGLLYSECTHSVI